MKPARNLETQQRRCREKDFGPLPGLTESSLSHDVRWNGNVKGEMMSDSSSSLPPRRRKKKKRKSKSSRETTSRPSYLVDYPEWVTPGFFWYVASWYFIFWGIMICAVVLSVQKEFIERFDMVPFYVFVGGALVLERPTRIAINGILSGNKVLMMLPLGGMILCLVVLPIIYFNVQSEGESTFEILVAGGVMLLLFGPYLYFCAKNWKHFEEWDNVF